MLPTSYFRESIKWQYKFKSTAQEYRISVVIPDSDNGEINRIAEYDNITAFETERERIKSFKWFNLAKGVRFAKILPANEMEIWNLESILKRYPILYLAIFSSWVLT